MKVFQARNPHSALPKVLYAITQDGRNENSRNGPVAVFDTPVTIEHKQPMERVIFWPERDANPTFHLLEALWMLAGRDDVAFPGFFAKQIYQYSDDGIRLHGAYGDRWRKKFGKDQLVEIIRAFRKNPEDRRQVLQMWSAEYDLAVNSKDVCCNVTAMFRVNQNRLDLTTVSRSQDLLWGALGANCVHFSVLQEYIASSVGLPVGKFYQFSNNLHVYKNQVLEKCLQLIPHEEDPWRIRNTNPYDSLQVFPLFEGMAGDLDEQQCLWDADLEMFFWCWDEQKAVGDVVFYTKFFRDVVVPIYCAYVVYKLGEIDQALDLISKCAADDWRLATTEWYQRRKENARKKQEAASGN